MTAGLLLAFMGFAFVTSITPGPNNTMLLASGVNYGFRRTLPHLAGITFGCAAMLVLVGLGLGEVFAAAPVLFVALRYGGAVYLVWLAWRIARSGPTIASPAAGPARGRPMGFWPAVAFQWINPKAWVMVVGAVTTYAPRADFLRSIVLIAMLQALVGAPCTSLWAGGGVALRGLLNRPGRVRAFNIGMALLLVLSLYPILER